MYVGMYILADGWIDGRMYVSIQAVCVHLDACVRDEERGGGGGGGGGIHIYKQKDTTFKVYHHKF